MSRFYIKVVHQTHWQCPDIFAHDVASSDNELTREKPTEHPTPLAYYSLADEPMDTSSTTQLPLSENEPKREQLNYEKAILNSSPSVRSRWDVYKSGAQIGTGESSAMEEGSEFVDDPSSVHSSSSNQPSYKVGSRNTQRQTGPERIRKQHFSPQFATQNNARQRNRFEQKAETRIQKLSRAI
ncbi:hypothetical protein BJ508DRAFT_312587 [Ascobolus immersus RN42]|uniref:Uncharacterized protein n=1 Tax=Ascobolus immersus RN42 TaxID=1160509 RepID=A0A3N4HSG3_ASCIM|nr:hypothetical protein BJ508DRAFT_312587 [Ascobolus immersus RN42]